MSINPYQRDPSGLIAPELTALPDARDFADAIASLARWQLFIAALGGIATAIMAILLSLQAIFAARSGSMAGARLSFSAILVGFAVLIYGLPTWKLVQAVRSLRRCRTGQGSLQEVFRDQLSFWRTMGFLLIVIMIFYFLAFLSMMLLGGLQTF